ncbi:hypothetical protein Tco_1292329 [Tanacetum coccineum]
MVGRPLCGFKRFRKRRRPATPEPEWTIPPNDFPEPDHNWANAYASTYKVPEENKMDECHKLLTDKVNLSNPEGHRIPQNINVPLPLGGPPGQVTIQPQFFLQAWDLVLSCWTGLLTSLTGGLGGRFYINNTEAVDRTHANSQFSDEPLTRVMEKLDLLVKGLSSVRVNKGMEIGSEHPSETIVFHNEDGNPARANIKQALGYLKDGDGDGNSQPHKGVKASANSDVKYSFTSAQDGEPLQDDVRLCLGNDLKKAQDHSQRQVASLDRLGEEKKRRDELE